MFKDIVTNVTIIGNIHSRCWILILFTLLFQSIHCCSVMYDLYKAHSVLYFRCNEPHLSVETWACEFWPDNNIVPWYRKELISPGDIERTARDTGGVGGKAKSGKALMGHITEYKQYAEATRKRSKTFHKRMNADDFSFRKVTLYVSDSKSQH